MKQPHCKLIKAWADGAEIQYFNEYSGKWIDIPSPIWDSLGNYRIKPLPRSPGQVAFEAYYSVISSHPDSWKRSDCKVFWEAAAAAVLEECK